MKIKSLMNSNYRNRLINRNNSNNNSFRMDFHFQMNFFKFLRCPNFLINNNSSNSLSSIINRSNNSRIGIKRILIQIIITIIIFYEEKINKFFKTFGNLKFLII